MMFIKDYRENQILTEGALKTVELYKASVVKDELKRIIS